MRSLGLSFVFFLAIGGLSAAVELKEAEVTQVVHDVNLLAAQAAPHPATISDKVHEGTAVRTGGDSRAELTFVDKTLTRLGANTIFTFGQGARTFDLASGAFLMQVPKNSGGAKINLGTAATAAITGTTVMGEYNKGAVNKFIVLEGTARVCSNRDKDDCVEVHAGEMVAFRAEEKINHADRVDLSRIMNSALLIVDFPPLPSAPLIAAEVEKQQDQKNNDQAGGKGAAGQGDPTGFDEVDQSMSANETTASPSANPTATPSASPTATPTASPTATPTASPTATPTASPTATPTASPSATPTASPSATPTASPSATPTASPSATPTASPSATPTASPSATPTASPSATPTASPSATPTASPSATPTASPSATPTASPSATPTASPSATPTPSPSASPTPSPTASPSATPSKTGSPSTISSPNPYVIGSGTTISTDPTITTNGQTDFGTLYRGSSQDGNFTDWAFGSTSAFDTSTGINEIIDTPAYLPFAAFKFTSLTIDGAPTISTSGDGAAVSLALIGVNGLTVSSDAGTLTFAGIENLLLATQAGPIDSEGDFSGMTSLFFYARGASSDLTLGGSVNVTTLVAEAEHNVDIEGDVTTDSLTSNAGNNFGTGSAASVHADSVNIYAGNTLNFDASVVLPVNEGGFTNLRLQAGTTLNVANPNLTVTGSADLIGPTINLTGTGTMRFATDVVANFNAGAGGIQGSGVSLQGNSANIVLTSAGDINLGGVESLVGGETDDLEGSITTTGTGSLFSNTNIITGTVNVAGNISAGERLDARSITAGGTINVDDGIRAVGGSIMAGGDIMTASTLSLEVDENGMFGNITAGGDITADGGIFTPGDPTTVHADGTIRTPAVITGTLSAGQDIFAGDANGGFSFGIIANTITAGGTLFASNLPTLEPNNAGFAGDDGATSHDFVMTVGAISSTGPTYPILLSNGGDANPDFADSNPGNGGNITVDITAGGLTIGNAQNLDSIQANGGAYNASGPFGGGNGGDVQINTTGAVTVSAPSEDAPAISASTGIVSDVTSQYAGNGGTVGITSDSSITVNGTIQVSSDDARNFVSVQPDATSGDFSGRESASGGNIDLQSNLTTGTGITVGGSLLSLLSGSAPGPAGSITLSTEGADIAVTGTVRADFGTVTMDQDDPAGATPLISLDGGTVQAATFNINGAGDLTIGPTSPTAINIFGGTWNVPGNITLNAANTRFAYSFALNATAGGAINFTGGASGAPATLTLPLSGDTTFTAGAAGINGQFVDVAYSGAALNLNSGGDITLDALQFTDGYVRGSVMATGAIAITNDLEEGSVTAGTTIGVGGNVIATTLDAGTTIQIGGYVQAKTVNAGSDITAGTTYIQNINASAGVLTATNSIQPYIFSTDPAFPEQGAKAPHVYNIASIVSPNGIDFSGNQFGGIDGYSSGGILTINATTLNFDPAGGIGIVNFNGADAGAMDNGGTVFAPVAGDGGTFIANATGDITVTSDSPISATSGEIKPFTHNTDGAGGSVELNSTSGTVSVDSTIQVSSAEPTSTIAPFRASSKGGNITLTSGKSSGNAITVSNSSQLLALLSSAAPGPGGTITIHATGASSSASVAGTVQADRGTVDIRQTGDSGIINIATGATDSITLSGDIVKVGALGTNGTLNIGSGTINADTLLRLYAGGSNGTINFVANVTLGGNGAKQIAGDTVNIFDGVVVTVGGPAAADVYTNHANYTGFGGNGQRTGTFAGAGANAPQALANAPGFDSGPGSKQPNVSLGRGH